MNKWFFSMNHKDTSTLYFIVGIWTGMIGTALSTLIQTELRVPGSFIGDDQQIYNVVVTAHAFIMIFLWLYPL